MPRFPLILDPCHGPSRYAVFVVHVKIPCPCPTCMLYNATSRPPTQVLCLPSLLLFEPHHSLGTSLDSHAKPSIQHEALPLGHFFEVELTLFRLLSAEIIDACFRPSFWIANIHPSYGGNLVMGRSLAIIVFSGALEQTPRKEEKLTRPS